VLPFAFGGKAQRQAQEAVVALRALYFAVAVVDQGQLLARRAGAHAGGGCPAGGGDSWHGRRGTPGAPLWASGERLRSASRDSWHPSCAWALAAARVRPTP